MSGKSELHSAEATELVEFINYLHRDKKLISVSRK
jgi:hypothetical protein